MADQIKKLSAGHSIEVLDAIMTEVEEARGEYESLDARLDEISGEGYSKAEVDALLALKQNALNATQLAAVNSGINSTKVDQIETNKSNISKDEAALVEIVDGGAKNKLNFNGVSSAQTAGVAFTVNADGSVTATRVEASSSPANVALSISGNRVDVTSFCNGNYMLSGCPNGGGSTSYEIMATIAGGAYIKRDYGKGVLLTDAGTTTDIYIQLTVRSTFTGTITFRPMLCTKAAWNISNEYQPYRPSYQELYERVVALEQANQ